MEHFELKERCQRLQQLHICLSSEVRLERLFSLIARKMKEYAQADTVYLYIRSGHELRMEAALSDIMENREASWREGLIGQTLPEDSPELVAFVARTGYPLNIDDVYELDQSVDYVFNPELDRSFANRTGSALIVPLMGQNGQTAGAVELYRTWAGGFQPAPFSEDLEQELSLLGGQAAVALANAERLVHAREVFNTLVRYSASAIDARSPQTAGHSRRVATLSRALAEAVNRQDSGPLASVNFTDEQLDELTYAAWLHDIGKIGVGEQLLDKTGKLGEDRMALIRCRFKQAALAIRLEIQARQMELHSQGLNSDRESAWAAEQDERLRQLREEMALVIRLNRPDSGDDQDMDRLEEIAAKEFVDGAGQVRRYLNDLELEALRLRHGNLTEAEYEEMKGHAARTRTIVSQIPFSQELARIPEFAGAHHEMLDGSGYPDGLKGDQIPWQARIIGVADIYDALVSPDRPYKEALHLDTALSILKQEAAAGRLDAALVQVFIDEDLAGRGEAHFRLWPREEL